MKSLSELTSASQVNNGDLLAISQTSGSGYASKKTTVKDITDKSNLNLAEEYDSTSTYAVDDYCIYESVLYKCTASTTGTFDSTKWTSVVVTDEMGSGGGGGTGGHTIIDENGNSMTARAGLQFVGANVDDDATNNKTVVDLASAGGIDGVFIDTDNVIKSATNFRGSLTYTATEDCAFCLYLVTQGNTSAQVRIDGIAIIDYWKSSMDTPSFPPIFLKKGQILSIANANASYDSTYRVYGIQTGTTHSKFQPVIYSLEEREIGVWTDGKPLYQKVFDLGSDTTISYNSWTLTTISLSGIERLVEIFCGNSTGTAYYGDLLGGNNNGYLQLQTPRNNQNLDARYIVVSYTKTTDVAGSGTWTPQGVPTHHYSTDEHIVGTWIDGKTLYEKTFDFSSNPIVLTPNQWVDSTVPSSINIDTLVNHELRTDAGVYNLCEVTKGAANYVIGIRNDISATNRNMHHLTIQYTKSS